MTASSDAAGRSPMHRDWWFRPALALVALVALALLATHAGGAPGSLGVFASAQANGANAFATDTLQPPTGLGAVASSPTSVDLTWTESASPYAAGYRVLRSDDPGGPYAQVADLAGRLTTDHTDPGLTTAEDYYYVVVAYYENWTSTDSNEASATPN